MCKLVPSVATERRIETACSSCSISATNDAPGLIRSNGKDVARSRWRYDRARRGDVSCRAASTELTLLFDTVAVCSDLAVSEMSSRGRFVECRRIPGGHGGECG